MFFDSFFKYRELLNQLTQREIKARYKQSVLGYAWVILNPLCQMLVMSFVFAKILRFTDLDVPYTLFLYIGLLPWTLFSQSLTSSMNVLVGNSSLITKIYFPRETFVISTIFAKIVDFLLACTVLIGFLVFSSVPYFTWNLLWIIPIFFIQQIFTYAVSLILAAFNLFYRDIQYIVSLGLLVWMYLTPIIYPPSLIPEKYSWLFIVNPLAIFIDSYRKILLYGQAPDLIALLGVTVFSTIFVALCWMLFKRLEGVFADVV